jgi:hypothetical protein
MNNLGKKFDFMIDASGSAAFVWLALSTVSSPNPTQTGGEFGTAALALLPVSPQIPASHPTDMRACSHIPSAIVNHPRPQSQ